MSEVKCPNCGTLAEYIPGESEFCPECSSELKPADAPDKQDVFSSLDLSSLLSKVAEAGQKIPDLPVDAQLSAATQKISLDQIHPDTTGRSAKTHTPYVEVDYNVKLFFIKGVSGVIRMHITPRSDLLKGIMVFLEIHAGEQVIRRPPYFVTEELQNGESIEIRLPYCPEDVSGSAAFDFYIGCNLQTETKYYKFSVDHMIYEPEQSSQGGQFFVNIENDHAGEVNIGDALHGLGNKPMTKQKLLERLRNEQPSFVLQYLRETKWRPEKIVVNGTPYPADRLLLEWNNKRIVLIGRKRLMLGRSPDCDLIVRSRGSNGNLELRDYPNNTVSRIHAEILYNGDSVQIFDKSSHGTYVNDSNLDGGDMTLPESAEVEFGDIFWHMNLQYCRSRMPHAICQTCVANRIKSLTFKRKDSEPECYLLVWLCCELGMLFPELADWVVFFRDNAFFIRTPDQNFHYLRPGGAFNVNQQTIKVSYY